MRNYDEAILRGRRIDRAAPFPALHQALRIALYDEYAARAFFRNVVDAFGPRPPFTGILASQDKRIAELSALGREFGVARPLDPFAQEAGVAPGWRANCERAVAGEAAKIRLYESLLAQVGVPRVRKLFRRLAAESFERRLPAFRQAVADAVELERLHGRQGVPPEQAHIQHGLVSDFLERTFSILSGQHQAIGVVGPLLRNTRPAMLAGFVAGGTGVLLAKGKLNLNRNGKDG